MDSFSSFGQITKHWSELCIFKALKQIFLLKSLLCVCLNDNLNRLLAKVCLDASFVCFFLFVAFHVTFNNVCGWTQRCGLRLRIHLRVTDQSWQAGPNESVLHFEVVFVVSWHEIGKLVKLIVWTVSLLWLKIKKYYHNFVYSKHWNKSSDWKAFLGIISSMFWADYWQKFVSMLHLWVYLDLLQFGHF